MLCEKPDVACATRTTLPGLGTAMLCSARSTGVGRSICSCCLSLASLGFTRLSSVSFAADSASDTQALPELRSGAPEKKWQNARPGCAAQGQQLWVVQSAHVVWRPLASLVFPLLQSMTTDSASDTQALPERSSRKLGKTHGHAVQHKVNGVGCSICSCCLASLGFTRLPLKLQNAWRRCAAQGQ